MKFDMTAVFQRLLDEAYRVVAALPLLIFALLIVWAAWLAGRWISQRAWVAHASKSNPFLQDLARTTVRWFVLGLGVLIALEIMQATALVGAVLGTAGVLGVALGFAFKGILENYLAGILMSVRQPFSPRDHVVIDGNEGIVVALTSRATVLMTLDGNHLRIPNALVFGSVTLNYTRNPSRRFDFEIGVGVNEDLIRAQSLGIDELTRIEGVMDKPPPRALITALGDSNVQVAFHGWVDQRAHEFLQVRSEAIRRVKLALERAGMDMPEPIYRVQLHEARKTEAGKDATPGREGSGAGVSKPVDTRATKDVLEQIDNEQQSHPQNDLLDPAAPRE
ncbi:mechanosensitive ion channel family protein [Hydrogenophaga sp. PAMC20947]|uniref:mechanosensitive ion channel family protein n=1 Tax=Hydrogenophaga sp. PAMC20947 TaxID=2565558 RepID=UPI0014454E58|nr:mechanosensitive ion channel family protein [Hydrogenophaga sp. PAMC20947]